MQKYRIERIHIEYNPAALQMRCNDAFHNEGCK